MAVTSVNLSRISFNQRAANLRESLRSAQTSLYQVQNSLSTGLRFQRASEDPLRAASAAILNRRLGHLNQISTNLEKSNAVLTEVESASQSAVDLFSEAQALAVQAIGDTTTSDERQSLTTVVDSLLEQLVTVGNRKYLNTYLFSGQQNQAPFELKYGGVLYTGDGNSRQTIVENDLTQDSFTVPGLELFGAVSSQVSGAADLNPGLTLDTRISDLGGAAGKGVQLGRLSIQTAGQTVEVDLSSAATIGDVIVQLNAALPGGLRASLGTQGIVLSQPRAGTDVVVTEIGGGCTARDLGLVGTFNSLTRPEVDLNARLTPLTKLKDLQVQGGLDLTSGFVIHNGGLSATIDLSGAQTIEDALNTINQAGVGVWARIASDGRRLEVVSRLSGADLTIEENGGLTATGLGLRSMHAGTTLAELNGGAGVQTVSGADLRITTASGRTIDVDLDGATTLQDVINRLNNAGAGTILAGFARQGNGLMLTDLTLGAGTFTIEALNESPALSGLGLNVTATGNQLVGRDVNPIRVDSPFTALLELRDGLARDDRLTMQTAGQRIDSVLEKMQRVQGQTASQARVMSERTDRLDTETSAAQVMLSDVRDVNYTDAIVRFQQLQTALQANLSTASKVLNLSLLDYLT